MRVAVWGAGAVGTGLVHRLTTCPFVSEIRWVNRTFAAIDRQAIDIRHGLAHAPTCWRVEAHAEDQANDVLGEVEVLVLTLGKSVAQSGGRKDVYVENVGIFRQKVFPALAGFEGQILVISNPVDLMARLVFKEGGVSHERVVGLGTVVETARLRAAVSGYLPGSPSARSVRAYAVGTHDEKFLPILFPDIAPGQFLSAEEIQELLPIVRAEVSKANKRVRTADSDRTLHPIVEGAVAVLAELATPSRMPLTISVLDPDSPDALFYSVPCTIDSCGIERHVRRLEDGPAKTELETCIASLRATLQDHPSA